MARGVRLYLVGSFVLVSLAGCGPVFFWSEERHPWRAEAEIACLKSGAVKESADLVRIDPISGPGVCGAEFPLKVAALGESSGSFGFADDNLRPPGNIGNAPRWAVSQPPPPQPSTYPETAMPQPGYGAPPSGPISLTAPGVAPPEEDDIDLSPQGTPGLSQSPARGPHLDTQANPPRDRYSAPYSPRPDVAPQPERLPRLGPGPGNSVAAFGPVAVRPAATLACPIVSVLESWVPDFLQPAGRGRFGARLVGIK